MNIEALKAAVQFLIDASPEDARRYREVLSASLPCISTLPVRFSPEYALLDPFIDAAKEEQQGNPGLLDRLYGVVQQNRRDDVFAPQDADNKTSGRNTNTYMRALMRERRERASRAVDIENMGRPESKKLKGAARHQFIRKVETDWTTRREAYMEQLRAEEQRVSGRRRLSKAQVTAACEHFWDKVDTELDELESIGRAAYLKK